MTTPARCLAPSCEAHPREGMTVHRPTALAPASSRTFRMKPGASAAWLDESGRWLVFMRDASWIARDTTLPADPREHGRDQERAFYSAADMLAHIDRMEGIAR